MATAALLLLATRKNNNTYSGRGPESGTVLAVILVVLILVGLVVSWNMK